MSLNQITGYIFLIEIIIILMMVIYYTPTFIEITLLLNRRKKFGKEVSRLFHKQKLDRAQVEIFSKEYFLTLKDVKFSLRKQIKTLLNEDDPSKEKLSYLQKLYEEFERDEPFEGLPTDIRFHLEKAREALGKENDHILYPLTSQLQELNDSNIRRQQRMWLVAVASVIIGAASLGLSLYAFYKPACPTLPTNEHLTSHRNIY